MNLKRKKRVELNVSHAGSFKSSLFADIYSNRKVGNVADEQPQVPLEEGLDKALQFIIEEDYKQALSWLLGAYAVIADRATHFSFIEEWGLEEYRKVFDWICLRLCYCYRKTGDLMSAYYYIDQVYDSIDCTCFLQWIDVIIESKRPNALEIVLGFMDDDREWMEKWQEEARQTVREFLSNRLGYLYIEYNLLDEAREYFSGFLNNPTSEGYAREGLEYLDSIQR